MEICSQHLNVLEDGLKIRGIGGLRSRNEEEAEAIVRAFNGEPGDDDDPDLFDSLLTAQLIIFHKAIERVGPHLLEPNDAAGAICPLCQLQGYSTDITAQQWVDSVTDHILKMALDHGLVQPAVRQ